MALFQRPSDQIAAIINYVIVLIYIIFACIANILYLKRRDSLVKDAYDKEVQMKRLGGGGGNVVMGTGIDDKGGAVGNLRQGRRRMHKPRRDPHHIVNQAKSQQNGTSHQGGSVLANAGPSQSLDNVASAHRRHQPRSVSSYQAQSNLSRGGGAGQSMPSNYRYQGQHSSVIVMSPASSLPQRTQFTNPQDSAPSDSRASGGNARSSAGMSRARAVPPTPPPNTATIHSNSTLADASQTPIGSVTHFLDPNATQGPNSAASLRKTDSLLNRPRKQEEENHNNMSFGDDLGYNNIRESRGESQSRYSEEDESRDEISHRNLKKLHQKQKQNRKHRRDKAAGGARATAVSRDGNVSSSDDIGGSSAFDSDYGGGRGVGLQTGESGVDEDRLETRWSAATTNQASMAAVPGVDPAFVVSSMMFCKDRICRFFMFVVVFLLSRAVSTLGQLLALYDLPLKKADAYYAVSSWMYYCLPLVLLHIFSTVMERVDPSPVMRYMRYGVIFMFWAMTVTFFLSIVLVITVEDTIDQYWGVVVNVIIVLWYSFTAHYIPKRLRSFGAVLEPIAKRIRNTSILFAVTFFLRILFDLPPLQNYYIDKVGNYWIITIYLPFDLVPTGLTLLFLHSRESSAAVGGAKYDAASSSAPDPSMPLITAPNGQDSAGNDSLHTV